MKAKILYLLIATVILTTALYIAHTAETARQNEQRLLEELSLVIQAVESAQQELEQIEQENAEMRELLFNQARTIQIVTGQQDGLLSRSGRAVTAVNLPVQSRSGFTAAMLEWAFATIAPGMTGTGEAFIQAEDRFGINSLVLAAIAHMESDGGKSDFAQIRNNLAGLGANTASPNSAFYFDSKADSVFYLAELLATHYAPGGKYFGGSYDLQGIGVYYACDPNWAAKVAGRMEQIAIDGGDQ